MSGKTIIKTFSPTKNGSIQRTPPEIQAIFRANDVDYVNRIEACHNTPLIDPGQIPLKFSEYSFRPDQHILVVRDDYLCGGSKSRMAFDFIRDQVQKRLPTFCLYFTLVWWCSNCPSLDSSSLTEGIPDSSRMHHYY